MDTATWNFVPTPHLEYLIPIEKIEIHQLGARLQSRGLLCIGLSHADVFVGGAVIENEVPSHD